MWFWHSPCSHWHFTFSFIFSHGQNTKWSVSANINNFLELTRSNCIMVWFNYLAIKLIPFCFRLMIKMIRGLDPQNIENLDNYPPWFLDQGWTQRKQKAKRHEKIMERKKGKFILWFPYHLFFSSTAPLVLYSNSLAKIFNKGILVGAIGQRLYTHPIMRKL